MRRRIVPDCVAALKRVRRPPPKPTHVRQQRHVDLARAQDISACRLPMTAPSRTSTCDDARLDGAGSSAPAGARRLRTRSPQGLGSSQARRPASLPIGGSGPRVRASAQPARPTDRPRAIPHSRSRRNARSSGLFRTRSTTATRRTGAVRSARTKTRRAARGAGRHPARGRRVVLLTILERSGIPAVGRAARNRIAETLPDARAWVLSGLAGRHD